MTATRSTASPATNASVAQARIQSLDVLRGLVMVIMAIDHIRDFIHADSQLFAPEDLSKTTTAIFFTRWITHFCAPTFIFLAGTSAYLFARRAKSLSIVSRFLLTRGLWLIVAEMTLILFAGTFNLSYSYIIWQVMWAIGWSMIALSVLVYVPLRVLLPFSLIVIAGHNLLDGLKPEQFGSLFWLWQILHVGPGFIPLSDQHALIVVYPLIPWITVMSAGYCFGRVYDLDPARRRRVLLRLGLAVIAGFVLLRLTNLYGDPSPWSLQTRPMFTLLSFVNTSKYPPSLLYLLMTLGPAILLLRAFDGINVSARNPLLVFGRVPFFYYILHWYVLHLVALGMAQVNYGHFDFLFGLPPSMLPFAVGYPPNYGYSLPTVYLVWCAIIAALYPVCLWFAGVKARNRSPWLSYL